LQSEPDYKCYGDLRLCGSLNKTANDGEKNRSRLKVETDGELIFRTKLFIPAEPDSLLHAPRARHYIDTALSSLKVRSHCARGRSQL